MSERDYGSEDWRKLDGRSPEEVAEDEGHARWDMTQWTPEQEAFMTRKLDEAVKYLNDNGQNVTREELRRLWAVANAYKPSERNMAIPDGQNFDVHAVFLAVPDRKTRQKLLMSRNDWTVEEAEEAVRALDRHTAPDAEKRQRGMRPER